jgi:PKD repeat protein
VNGAVAFTDESTNTPTSWLWNFGEGNSSVLQNPEKIFYGAGIFDISLQATNAGGSDFENKSGYITVEGCLPPDTDFIYNASCGVLNLTVQFTDSSTELPTSWYWEFGDGNTSIAEDPVFQYNVLGNWSVNHSSTNLYGTTWENTSEIIHVLPLGSTCGGGTGSGGGWQMAQDNTIGWTALFFALFGLPVIVGVFVKRK